MNRIELCKKIDHTLLKPEAKKDDILRLCREAKEYGFATVCVNPIWVSLCAQELQNTGVAVAAVIGFPLGANMPQVKAYESAQAVKDGAVELDMVINLGWIRDGQWDQVENDIKGVVEAARPALVKVILETSLLTEEQKIEACKRSVRAGALFVKTSTGFGPGGAAAADVRLMRQTVGSAIGVKASGGVRSREAVQEMLDAGASRIGTSSSLAILKDWEA